MTVELRSARSLDRAERAELFTAAYEGYLLPFRVDEATLTVIEEAFDIDVDASRIAYRDGVPVGLGNLGIRGEEAWIGGVGVVPAARRSGVGEALMCALHDEARERGIQRIWLEVIVENASAFALYEKLGYRIVRDVEVWSLPAAEDGETGTAAEVPEAETHARIREQRTGREPWQRADETVANYGDARGIAAGGNAILLRGEGPVQVLQLAGEIEPLLRSLRAFGAVSVLNLPTDDPAGATLRSLGGSVVVRQHEMLLDL